MELNRVAALYEHSTQLYYERFLGTGNSTTFINQYNVLKVFLKIDLLIFQNII